MGKYNYVLVKNASDYYRLNYSEIIGRDDVCYLDNFAVNFPFLLRIIHKLHNSQKLNRYIPLPFKSVWFPYYFKHRFTDSKPLCFIVDASPLYLTPYIFDYILYLKKKYEKAKFVLFYQDMIKLCPDRFRPQCLKSLFNLIITYDYIESVEYGILYHPTVGSYNFITPADDVPQSDVFLLAKAKNRLPLIIQLYKFLTNHGIRCEFIILEANVNQREYYSGIHYFERPLSYRKNLEYVQKTKCILELMQEGAVGYTLRLWEAILYDKKLLTNNKFIKSSHYYDPSYVSVINIDSDLVVDIDFLKTDMLYDNPHKLEITPSKFLNFIEEKLL